MRHDLAAIHSKLDRVYDSSTDILLSQLISIVQKLTEHVADQDKEIAKLQARVNELEPVDFADFFTKLKAEGKI